MQYRKFTRLKNYDYSTNGYYFVTVCVNDHRDLFGDIKDGKMVLNDVGKIINDAWQWLGKQYEYVELDQFIIMPNHLHVIICINSRGGSRTAPTRRTAPTDDSRIAPTTKRKPLGRLIGAFKTVSTKQINIMRQTAGKQFWQRNYYEHIIRDENALYSIREYILENPLKERIDWNNIYRRGCSRTAPTDDSLTTPTSQHIPAIRSGAAHRANKGISLIIAVFAIMLFSVLGWTLVRIQSTDFESNVSTGNLNSERALNLAEAGAQYALTQLSLNACWRTGGDCASVDTDCTDNPDWLPAHTVSPGQYRICCRQPVLGVEDGDAVIVSRGYVPQAVEPYRAMRQIKIEVELGSLANVLQTQIPDPDDQTTGLFDWSKSNNQPPVAPLHNIQIEGAIEAGHYEADNDGIFDELGQDYDPPPGALLPNDITGPPNDSRTFSASFPSIAMDSFYNNPAYTHWPPDARNVSLRATASDTSTGSSLRVLTDNFFNDGGSMRWMAVHNITDDLADDDEENWGDAHWRIITNIPGGFIGRRAIVSPAINDDWDNDLFELVMRFYDQSPPPTDYSTTRVYAGREEVLGGETADMLIDLNDGAVRFVNSSLISEGDTIIKGPGDNELRMSYTAGGTIYPMLATKNGNILSFDAHGAGSETNRVDRRRIAGLIYSEFGQVYFNYLRYPTSGPGSRRRNLIYGKKITLDGRILLRYGPAVRPSGDFVVKPSLRDWNEE